MQVVLRRWAALVMAALLVAALAHSLGHAQTNPVPPSALPSTPSDPYTPNAKTLATALGDDLDMLNYQVQDFEWKDTSRHRELPVRLYLPIAASAARPVPLVVFSHGLGGSRLGYSYLGRYLAQNGVASLHLQHVGSDRTIWAGSIFGLTQRLKDATTEAEALARTEDFRFALTTALAHPELGPRLDAQKVIAAGHSFGANTSLLIAGAKVTRDGQALSLQDARVKGVVLMSSPTFYGAATAQQALAGMHLPSLHITATDDVIRVPGYFSSADERVAVYEAYQGAAKSLVVFKDGSHSVFTDRLNTGGLTQNPLIKRATREITLAFVLQVVGALPPLTTDNWMQRHASILARVENLTLSLPTTRHALAN